MKSQRYKDGWENVIYALKDIAPEFAANEVFDNDK